MYFHIPNFLGRKKAISGRILLCFQNARTVGVPAIIMSAFCLLLFVDALKVDAIPAEELCFHILDVDVGTVEWVAAFVEVASVV